MESAFGVDHGDFSKAEKKATGGRQATAYLFPGFHGAVAGKKGHKLRAAGTELGTQAGGAIAGGLVGGTVARKAPVVGSLMGTAGGAAGSIWGTQHAQKVGHYKKQPKGSL